MARFFSKFYDNILVYILLPSAPLLVAHYLLLFALSMPMLWILGMFHAILSSLYMFLRINEKIGCLYCLSETLYTRFLYIMPLYSIMYIWWDIKKKHINLNFKTYILAISSKFKNTKQKWLEKLTTYIFYPFYCLRQIFFCSIKKALLGMILPLLIAVLEGDEKFPSAFDSIAGGTNYGINPGGRSLDNFLYKEMSAIYHYQKMHHKLGEKFGDINNYISKEEIKNLKFRLIDGLVTTKDVRFRPDFFIRKLSYMNSSHDFRGVTYTRAGRSFYSKDYLHYSKDRHMCKYNKNGIGEKEMYYYTSLANEGFIFSTSKEELLRKLQDLCLKSQKEKNCPYTKQYIGGYKCPKYRDFTNLVETTLFSHYLPSNKNVYFSDSIYLGVYEELINAVDGKLFKIVLEVAKYPCTYVDKYSLECNEAKDRRKFKFVKLYVYNKAGKVVNNIKIKRED